MNELSTQVIKEFLRSRLPQMLSLKEELDYLWDDWIDIRQWKRMSKSKLKESSGDYFNTDFGFPIDRAGHVDDELYQAMLSDPDKAANCIARVFIPTNEELVEQFRIEIISNPEDDRIIGWTVISD